LALLLDRDKIMDKTDTPDTRMDNEVLQILAVFVPLMMREALGATYRTSFCCR
jgi:hypothetical protein